MVFYVCRGRVQIDISGVQFSAGKGCVFQVPRGKQAFTRGRSTGLTLKRKAITTALLIHTTWMRGCFSPKAVFQWKTMALVLKLPSHPRPSSPLLKILRQNQPLKLAVPREVKAGPEASRRLVPKRLDPSFFPPPSHSFEVDRSIPFATPP